jgi:zinc protease
MRGCSTRTKGGVMSTIDFVNSDAELWESVCREDQSAFEALVRKHQAAVCAVAYNACGNISMSEDVSQETFWIAWRDRMSLKDPSKLRGWLCGIARNLARNSVRRTSEAATSLDDCAEAAVLGKQPFEQAVSREEESLVWEALQQIPETYREPLILFYRENQFVSDVATTLEISDDAVKQRLSRGRNLLRDQVLELVEGTLRRSGPRSQFTVGVMAGLTSVAVGSQAVLANTGAVAAGVSGAFTGAKIVPLATTAGAAGMIGGLLGIVAGVCGGWLGTWIPAQLAPTNQERQRILATGRRIMVSSLVMIVLLIGLLLIFRNSKNSLSMIVTVLGWLFLFQAYVAIETLFLVRSIRRIREETKLTSDPNDSPTKAYVTRYMSQWQGRVYRSSASFLGIPLIDIQVSNPSLTGEPQPVKTAFGWIAIGDRAVGILVAIGGVARGGIAIGGLSIGLISIGGASFGLLSAGGLAIGAIAVGGLGIGGIAFGGGALGWQAAGGGAIAWDVAAGGGAVAYRGAFGGAAWARDYAVGGNAFATHANDELARSVLETHWLVRAMKASTKYPGWMYAAIMTISVLPGLAINLLMYCRRPVLESKQELDGTV